MTRDSTPARATRADGDGDNERIWERGWDGHERAQRERIARLPLWEKIAWLEEAQRVARALGAKERPSP